MQTTGEAACKVNANTDAETVEKPLSESDATAVEVEATLPIVNDEIVPAEKAVEENVDEMVAVKAVTDQSQKKAAEKLADRRKWLCLSQGCLFVCLFMLWTGVGPITEYSCDKPVPVFLSAMAKKQTPPIERPWCYHTGASLNGKPD